MASGRVPITHMHFITRTPATELPAVPRQRGAVLVKFSPPCNVVVAQASCH